MVAYPVLSCKVAFANNPYDHPLTFTELGPASGAGPGGLGWLRDFKSKRGRQRLLRSQSQFQAGTLNATLDNRDRRFDPTNTAGPYYPNVQPEKVIQIGATWAGTYYPIWTGFVDDWPQVWPGFSEGNVPLVATDLFKALSLARVLSPGYSASVLADSPVGYWRCGDVTGSPQLADSSTSNLPASLAGTAAPTFGGAGALPADPNTSVDLSGAAGILLPLPATPPTFTSGVTGSWMISFWINFTSLPSSIALLLSIPGGPEIFQYPSGDLLFASQDDVHTFTTGDLADGGLGTWHRVDVYTYWTGSVRDTIFLVDGAAIGNVVGPWNTYNPGSQVAFNLPGYTGSSSYTGSVDEIAVYTTTAPAAYSHINAQVALAEWYPGWTGTRVNQVLSTVGVPTTLANVDTGYTWCQADPTNLTTTKALEYLQKCEQTEQGQCFVGADGTLNFQDRYHRWRAPDNTVEVTFSDSAGGINFAMGGVTLNFDRAELFNEVPVTRRNGNEQDAVNTTSQTMYTNRTMPGLSDLLMATDLDALSCGQWIVADTAYPQLRVGDLIVDPTANPNLWPYVLGLEIGQLLTVTKTNVPGGGPSVSLTCRIEGIEHQVSPPRSWTTTFHVSLQNTQPWLVLDSTAYGYLDSGCRYGW